MMLANMTTKVTKQHLDNLLAFFSACTSTFTSCIIRVASESKHIKKTNFDLTTVYRSFSPSFTPLIQCVTTHCISYPIPWAVTVSTWCCRHKTSSFAIQNVLPATCLHLKTHLALLVTLPQATLLPLSNSDNVMIWRICIRLQFDQLLFQVNWILCRDCIILICSFFITHSFELYFLQYFGQPALHLPKQRTKISETV